MIMRPALLIFNDKLEEKLPQYLDSSSLTIGKYKNNSNLLCYDQKQNTTNNIINKFKLSVVCQKNLKNLIPEFETVVRWATSSAWTGNGWCRCRQ